MVPRLGQRIETLLVLAAHVGEDRHGAAPEPALGEETGDLTGGLGPGGQDQKSRVRLDEGDHLLDRAAMHGKGFEVRHAPPHPGGGELEGGKLRVERDLIRRDRPTDARADREPQGVACRKDDHPLAFVGL